MSGTADLIRVLPLLNGLLPILAVHITYLAAAGEGYVPWCFPYVDSCTSISATGRAGTGFYLFKAFMIPAAVILAAYWWFTRRLLISLTDKHQWATAIWVIGCIGAVFLILYVLALGAAGNEFRIQRRLGIIVYFTFTYLAQLLLLWRLHRLGIEGRTVIVLQSIAVFLLACGLLTLVLAAVMLDYDAVEDAFEWVLALFIQLYFLATYPLWRQQRF